MSAAGIHGAPSRAVMSEGRRSGGCTALERRDIAVDRRIERGRGLRRRELVADRAREIGVGCLPRPSAGSRKMASPSSAITASASPCRSSAM